MPADKPEQADAHAERKGRPPYALSEEKQKDGFKAKYTGKCYCGNVTFEVDADPLDATYCHCRTCQHLHGAPYQWAAILHKDTVHIKTGYDDLHFYSPQHKKMEYVLPCKVSCGRCQSVIMDEGRNMVLLMPTLIDGMGEKDTGLEDNGPFRASHHMFYKTAVERVEDHLPKFGGKKGEEPMNEAAEKMAVEVEKKNKEKEAKKDEEEREKKAKKQKTGNEKKDE